MLYKRQIILMQLIISVGAILLGNHIVIDSQNQTHQGILQSVSELGCPPFAIVRADESADDFSVVVANGTYERLHSRWIMPILARLPVSLKTVIKYIFIILTPVILLLVIL